eukprot:6855526-Pyramimonas_sp.AAC.1
MPAALERYLGLLGAVLGASWGLLGAPWYWAPLGPLGGPLGPPWGGRGVVDCSSPPRRPRSL